MLPADEVPVTAGANRALAAPAALPVADGIAPVPTEHVLLMVVHLPLPSAKRRLAALPFAMEEYLSEPLERLHFALGQALGDQRYLAAAVAKDQMRAWVDLLEADGAGTAALVPDVLTVPVPNAGEWMVVTAGERALVRTADGAGFATRTAMLPVYWEQAGRPAPVAGAGAALPEALPVVETLLLPVTPVAEGRPTLDLRQGAFAPPRPRLALAGMARHWRSAAFVTAAGLAAHGAVAAADTLALVALSAKARAETQALVAAALPAGGAAGGDLADRAASLLPDTAAPRPPTFLPRLSAIAGALARAGAPVRLDRLTWAEQEDAFLLAIDVGDRAEADRLASALRAAGFQVTARLPLRRPDGLGVEMVVR